MVRYIKGNSYGYDANGDEIDESTVEELYRIAEREVLPTTELARIDRYCTIDEDTFDYYATTTNYGSYVSFDLYFTITTDDLDVMSFALPSARFLYDYKGGREVGEINFTIHVKNNEIKAIDIFDSTIDLSKYDTDGICDYVMTIAEPSIREIVNKVVIV